MRRAPHLLHRRPARAAVAIDDGRVDEIALWYGGRAMPVPQAFFDAQELEHDDPNTHPSLGPYTHTAVANGPWSSGATWNTGTVPGAGAVVNVSSFTVTYDLESDVLVKDVHVGDAGTLRWATDRDTRLWVDTLFCHGRFVMGTGADPVPESATPGKPRAEIVFHQTQAPLKTVRLGLATMGPVRIQGAPKADRLSSDATIPAGATAATLAGLAAANWRVGDTVLFVTTENAGTSPTDAQYAGPAQFYGPFNGTDAVRTQTLGFRLSHDEVRTVASITGDTVSFATPLAYTHAVVTGTLPHGQAVTVKPVVCNLSRSVRFRSADPSSLQTRAHTMFMHSDDVDVRYAEAKNMARTDTNPSLARPDGVPVTATSGGTVVTDANNVRGRYAFHLHGTGPYFGRRQAIFKGLVAWAPAAEVPQPGWAITHHNSRAAVENCVVYNARGAGIVSELGNEIGQWVDNTVVWCRGDGYAVSWGSRAEAWQNHNGHAGIGYESQARQVLQQGNVAASCHIGWFFMQQAVAELSRIPDTYSLRLYDPLTQGGGTIGGVYDQDQDTYGIEQAQIPDFDDNLVVGGSTGFGVAHRQFTDRADTTPMLARRFHCVAVNTPVNVINYTFNYSFYDFLWTGSSGTSAAASLGNVAWAFMFVNGRLRNYATGFFQNGLGFNFNGFWIDLAFEAVAAPFTSFTANFNIASWLAGHPGQSYPQDHPLFNLMGPWLTDTAASVPGSTWVGTLREWKALDSATDLPQPYPALNRGAGGIEPAPGTPKPYFWLDPAGDTSVTANTNSVSFKGMVVDRVGVRCWPETFSSESFSPSSVDYGRPNKRNENATSTQLVLRNGCFQEGGAWKTRLWFTEQERLTGEYFQFHVDLTVSGVAADVLAANALDPSTPPPLVPIRPERIGPVAREL